MTLSQQSQIHTHMGSSIWESGTLMLTLTYLQHFYFGENSKNVERIQLQFGPFGEL